MLSPSGTAQAERDPDTAGTSKPAPIESKMDGPCWPTWWKRGHSIPSGSLGETWTRGSLNWPPAHCHVPGGAGLPGKATL